MRQVCIDDEVKDKGLAPPFLIKLDTHGHEREILEGAAKTLPLTDILVVEVYNFASEERRFPAMCALIESLGFHCVDIGEPMWREHDGSFWQMDLFFVRAQSKEAQYQGYK